VGEASAVCLLWSAIGALGAIDITSARASDDPGCGLNWNFRGRCSGKSYVSLLFQRRCLDRPLFSSSSFPTSIANQPLGLHLSGGDLAHVLQHDLCTTLHPVLHAILIFHATSCFQRAFRRLCRYPSPVSSVTLIGTVIRATVFFSKVGYSKFAVLNCFEFVFVVHLPNGPHRVTTP